MKGNYAQPSDILARRKRDVILQTQRTKGKYVQIENKSMGFDNGLMQILRTPGLDTYFSKPNLAIPPTITFVSYTSPNATLAYTTGGKTISEYGFVIDNTNYPILNGNILNLTSVIPPPGGGLQTFTVRAYLVYDTITIRSSSRQITLSFGIQNFIFDAHGVVTATIVGDYLPAGVGIWDLGDGSSTGRRFPATLVSRSFSFDAFMTFGQSGIVREFYPYFFFGANDYRDFPSQSLFYDWHNYITFELSVNPSQLITYTLNTNNFQVIGVVTLHITSANGTESTTLYVPGTSVIDYAHDAIVSLNATANIGTIASINSGSPGINVTTENLEYNIETCLGINFRQEGLNFIYSLSPQFSPYIILADSSINDGWGTTFYGEQSVNFTRFDPGHESYDVYANIHFVYTDLNIYIYRSFGYSP